MASNSIVSRLRIPLWGMHADAASPGAIYDGCGARWCLMLALGRPGDFRIPVDGTET